MIAAGISAMFEGERPDPEKLERRLDRLAHRVIAAAASAGIDPFQLTGRINAIASGQGPKGEST